MGRMPSTSSVLIVEPTLGYDVSQPSMDLQLGQTPSSDNFILREGALEPRPMLSSVGSQPNPLRDVVLGGFASVDVDGNDYPVVSGTTRLAWYNAVWSVLSYVSANGVNNPPSTTSVQYWDMAQVYAPVPDQNIVIMAPSSLQSMYCWASGATVFSTLTEAPIARYVTAFDNYIVAFNIRDAASGKFVQRVQWSDRGNPFSWVPANASLAGQEDLLAMTGAGTRIIANENRLILFSTDEIWQGFPGQFPSTFVFQPFDRTTGCPFPWTVCMAQNGIYFMGGDYRIYRLPSSGGVAQAVSDPMHRTLRESIDVPERAFGVYDQITNHYQLHYAVRGGTGRPQKALYLNLDTGKWAPQSFDAQGGALALTVGFAGHLSSGATLWSQTSAVSIPWSQVNASWADYLGQTSVPTVFAASSTGTLYGFSSAVTTDDGAPVLSRWRSNSLMGDQPQIQKTIRELRVDYQTTSNSSLTLRLSTNQGASFGGDVALNLPSSSGESQAIAYPYMAGRYPSFEVQQQGSRSRLERFWLEYTTGGR